VNIDHQHNLAPFDTAICNSTPSQALAGGCSDISEFSLNAGRRLPVSHEGVLGGTTLPRTLVAASKGAAAINFSPLALYAVKYVSPRMRPLTPEEVRIRATAYALKRPTPQAIATAAPAMAALIDGPCWLVPVPASSGSLTANLVLARAIARLVPCARVQCAIARAHPVESCCKRRLRGLLGLTVDEHAIIRMSGPMDPLTLYFVDNVITSGNTIAACRRALGWGTGLTYADASSPCNTRRLSLSPTLS
jgi:hypothetical protein